MKRFGFVKASVAIVVVTLAVAAEADGGHKHNFSADVDAFHTQLSPLWHSPARPERSAAVCKAVPELSRLAAAITSVDAIALKAAVSTLQTQCGGADAEIESAFSAVHDAFHQIAVEKH